MYKYLSESYQLRSNCDTSSIVRATGNSLPFFKPLWRRTVVMRRNAALIACTLVLALFLVPMAAAQERQTGGTVVVAENETVDGLSTVAGSVEVHGTVNGDLTAVGGDIRIPGNVTGNVTAVGGSTTLSGDVGGAMSAFGGSVQVAENASIGRWFETGAGDATVDGTVGEDVRVQSETLVVGPTAEIGGNLEHATQSLSLANDASIAGEIRSVDSIEFTQMVPMRPSLPSWAFPLYGFVINVVLGAILLLLFPEFSLGIADRVRANPLFALLIGALTVFVTPILLGLLAVTVIGIPLAVLGLLIFLIVLWAGTVYGGFAIGAAILAAFDVTNRWAYLVVGLFVVFLLSLIPFIGGFIYFVVTLLGVGALVLGVRR